MFVAFLWKKESIQANPVINRTVLGKLKDAGIIVARQESKISKSLMLIFRLLNEQDRIPLRLYGPGGIFLIPRI